MDTCLRQPQRLPQRDRHHRVAGRFGSAGREPGHRAVRVQRVDARAEHWRAERSEPSVATLRIPSVPHDPAGASSRAPSSSSSNVTAGGTGTPSKNSCGITSIIIMTRNLQATTDTFSRNHNGFPHQWSDPRNPTTNIRTVADSEFKLVLDAVRRLVRNDVMPREQEIEDTDAIPGDLRRKAADMGLFGFAIPEEYGGLGLNMRQ